MLQRIVTRLMYEGMSLFLRSGSREVLRIHHAAALSSKGAWLRDVSLYVSLRTGTHVCAATHVPEYSLVDTCSQEVVLLLR